MRQTGASTEVAVVPPVTLEHVLVHKTQERVAAVVFTHAQSLKLKPPDLILAESVDRCDLAVLVEVERDAVERELAKARVHVAIHVPFLRYNQVKVLTPLSAVQDQVVGFGTIWIQDRYVVDKTLQEIRGQIGTRSVDTPRTPLVDSRSIKALERGEVRRIVNDPTKAHHFLAVCSSRITDVLFNDLRGRVDSNGNDQLVTTNGVSGSTEPTWETSGDTTDGTVTWHIENEAGPPSAEVHVIIEVIEGVSPMPLYPASLEWVSPPVETPAGDPIPDIVVMVKDQNGDPYQFFPLSMRIDIVGAGTMVPTPQEAMDKATGLVTFSGVSITEPGTYVIRARMVLSVVADPILSEPFEITTP